MRGFFRTSFGQLLVAYLTVSMVGGSAQAQVIDNQVPGLGANTPAKVMIIFDTSKSMQHMPQSDLVNDLNPLFSGSAYSYFLDAGNYNFLTQDFDQGNQSAPCLNRFCIGKKVLYNVLPTYTNDIQAGLAGYYQYRTSYIPPGGTTQCKYDVLEAGNILKVLPPDPNPSRAGTLGNPPSQSTCYVESFGSTYQYNPTTWVRHHYTLDGGTLYSAGVTETCSLANKVPTVTVSTNATHRAMLANHGCSNGSISSYTRPADDSPSETWRNGAMAPNSNIFVRLTDAGVCNAGQMLRYLGRNPSNDVTSVVASGSPSYAAVSPPLNQALEPRAGKVIFNDTLNPDNLPLLGCSNTKPCDLTLTGLNTRYDATRTSTWVFADASVDYTWNGILYALDGGPSQIFTGSRALAGMACQFHDGTAADVVGKDIHVSSLNMATSYGMTLPTSFSCASNGAGCRIEYRGVFDAGPSVGTWSFIAPPNPGYGGPGTSYRTSGETAPKYRCSASMAIADGTYGTAALEYATVIGSAATNYAACSNLSAVTSGSIGGQTINGSAGCGVYSACDFFDGGYSPTPDNTLRYHPIYPPVPNRIDAGVVNFQVLSYRVQNYAGVCPSSLVGETMDDNGALFSAAGCTAGTPCQLTFLGYTADGGNVPDTIRYTPSLPPFDGGTDDAGFPIVYSYSGNPGQNTGIVAMLPAAGLTCPTAGDTQTVTDGTFGIANCTTATPCLVTSQGATVYCFRAGDQTPVSCPVGSDSTVLRKCAWDVKAYLYTGIPFGQCLYQQKKFNLASATCSYTRMKRTSAQPAVACNGAPSIGCSFRVIGNRYSFIDPKPYCEAVVNRWTYTGSTGNLYQYTYQTKGGEYIGSVTMVNSMPDRPLTSQRNWCELGATYGSFASECPAKIDSTNLASFPQLATQCAGGRTCLLRWRSSLTSDAGVLYSVGRTSYSYLSYGSTPLSEVYDPNNVRCLAPDRAGGELDQPSPHLLMQDAGAAGTSIILPTVTPISFPPAALTTTNWSANHIRLSNIVAGVKYRITVTASQPAVVGGSNSAFYMSFSAGTPVCYQSGTCTANSYNQPWAVVGTMNTLRMFGTVPTTGVGTYTMDAVFPIGGATPIYVGFYFTNPQTCATCVPSTRSINFHSFNIERVLTDFCGGIGQNQPTQLRLRSDWYDNGQASNPQPFADITTNQPTRNRGWSEQYDGGQAEIFVPMAIGNTAALQKALGQCVRPVDLNTPLAGGLCTSDTDNCGPLGDSYCQSNDAGMTDFTPLYGSLKNAQTYMAQQLADDEETQYQCRDYYVVLVTDGLESTPRGYTQSDLTSVVTAMRNTTAAGRNKDVKTFVIGFGAGLSTGGDAGLSDVDVIARAGGTALRLNPLAATLYDAFIYDTANGFALSATNQAQLEQSLNWVFSAISAGRFARSRPSISSDGKRIYQAYFDRGDFEDAGSPELLGNILAFRVETTGQLTQMWEYRPKLDAQLSRDLRAMLPLPDGGVQLTSFVSSNTALTTFMNTSWGAGTDAGGAVVDFVRNDGKGAGVNEKYAPIPVPRTTRAGAIMFSTPVAVGAPPFGMNYGGNYGEVSKDEYLLYKTQNAGRPQRLLFGSSDGIYRGLHELSDAGACIIEADAGCPNGSEAWGVVSSEALVRLQNVRGGGARPIVDGTTAVADVCMRSGGGTAADCVASEFRTVAVATMRHGGQAIFALDVTDGGFPTPLWQFSDQGDVDGDELGLTYSIPTIGRVSYTVGGVATKKWVVFMGGGYATNTFDGRSFYVLDIATGKPLLGPSPTTHRTKWPWVLNSGESFAGRPSAFKPVFPTTTADIDTIYMGDNVGQLWMMRTRTTGNPARDWEPEPFYTSSQDVNSNRANRDGRLVTNPTEFAPLWKMNKTTLQRCVSGDACYTACSLPLGSGGGGCSEFDVVPKFYNRPKIDMKYDVTLVKPDVFIGTGDTQNITSTTAVDDRDFIFALHDNDYEVWRGANAGAARADNAHAAETLWVYALDPGERVLGEPAFIGGSVVFATYVPAANGCRAFGDSYLYAFDPRTGAPKQALKDPVTQTFKSVVKLGGVGPVSDLISMNGNIYYATARNPGTPEFVQTKQTGLGGRVHGWRRVR